MSTVDDKPLFRTRTWTVGTVELHTLEAQPGGMRLFVLFAGINHWNHAGQLQID